MKTVSEFQTARDENRKISMVTCYDYTSARIVAASNADCILVGDSLAMTMHGHDTTLDATPELMALHVAAVRRGAPEKFIVADMPFLAHRGSLDRTMDAVHRLMRSGAQAIKIEGIEGSEDTIRHIAQSGVPVMGHLGMTPQSVHQFSGFKVQAKDDEAAEVLYDQAIRLEQLGVFALVIECVPAHVAALATQKLRIPTIGIGAGADCSGQVLVLHDLLGLNVEFQPRFVRRYMDGFGLMKAALDQYDADVKSGDFPNAKEQY